VTGKVSGSFCKVSQVGICPTLDRVTPEKGRLMPDVDAADVFAIAAPVTVAGLIALAAIGLGLWYADRRDRAL
jgi:hypothetical protein